MIYVNFDIANKSLNVLDIEELIVNSQLFDLIEVGHKSQEFINYYMMSAFTQDIISPIGKKMHFLYKNTFDIAPSVIISKDFSRFLKTSICNSNYYNSFKEFISGHDISQRFNDLDFRSTFKGAVLRYVFLLSIFIDNVIDDRFLKDRNMTNSIFEFLDNIRKNDNNRTPIIEVFSTKHYDAFMMLF